MVDPVDLAQKDKREKEDLTVFLALVDLGEEKDLMEVNAIV